ncbi:MAG: DinB family protein [Chthoniobacterales bacterium]|nr:DinB family protein [Chthoniobacterales bacterium]
MPKNAEGKLGSNASHSVGMLVQHLVFWNENALARFRGERPPRFGDSDETFTKFDAANWDDLVLRLDKVMQELEDLVEKTPENKLADEASTISSLCTHNAYHIGQILSLRVLQGSWNPEDSVE